MLLVLAFDTATDRATSALVDDGEVLGERVSRASTLLEDVDALLRQAGAHPRDVDALALGTGPGASPGSGSGSLQPGEWRSRSDVPAAGVSTLDALAAGAPGSTPVIDAKRREVFVPGPARRCARERRARRQARSASATAPSATGRCSRLPAARCRPTTTSGTCRGRASTPALARDFGPVELVEPLYVRLPDAVEAGR